LYGLSCDLDAIIRIASANGIGVINDAAQSLGSIYKGRPIANIADITSYSLENSKHITTGDGGIVVTDNEEYAVKMRKFNSLGYAAMKSGDGRIRINKDIFQDPGYRRHDSFGFNYRMPEVAAALGLAQTERLNDFVNLRIAIGGLYKEAIGKCQYLIPQHTPEGCVNTYWAFAVKYERDDVSWQEFREKYIEFGGDGIYAAWALIYDETFITSGDYKKLCPPYYNDLN
jgi:perosamine synthetase